MPSSRRKGSPAALVSRSFGLGALRIERSRISLRPREPASLPWQLSRMAVYIQQFVPMSSRRRRWSCHQKTSRRLSQSLWPRCSRALPSANVSLVVLPIFVTSCCRGCYPVSPSFVTRRLRHCRSSESLVQPHRCRTHFDSGCHPMRGRTIRIFLADGKPRTLPGTLRRLCPRCPMPMVASWSSASRTTVR